MNVSFSKANTEAATSGQPGTGPDPVPESNENAVTSEDEGGLDARRDTTKYRPPPLDISAAQQNASGSPNTPPSATPRPGGKADKERKIGHRRVDEEGQITYKKIQTSQIMGSIQLGIGHSIGSLASKPDRDLLMQDFSVVETTVFTNQGSNHTPAHHYADFRFKAYAPVAFRYFRDLFGIQPDDFLLSMCNEPMRELTNPGASGSIFYLTGDDEFIIKTVQHKEGEFLQKLLPGYYMNLNQNPRTLLPKFFGLYCYQCGGKNIRMCVMNNLLPSTIRLHQKYDLKGSTYKRKANKYERDKNSPTFKDLDFIEHHPEGILLENDTYVALIKTMQRDCRVLESFKIMDYSLLIGVHNLDLSLKEKQVRLTETNKDTQEMTGEQAALARSKSINRQKLVAHSTAMEAIQADVEPIDEDDDVPNSSGGIPARNTKGERLLLFIGIIDILQSYRLKKKLEHTWKSMLHDGDTVSVHRPSFYAQRFQDFMAKKVFKKIPSPTDIRYLRQMFFHSNNYALKHSPSRKKSLSKVASGRGGEDDREGIPIKDFPGYVPNSYDYRASSFTPPPSFEEAVRTDKDLAARASRYSVAGSEPRQSSIPVTPTRSSFTHSTSISHSPKESTTSSAALSVQSFASESSSYTSGIGSSTARTMTWTPPLSVEGSTPTHTEGCPTTPIRGLLHHKREYAPSPKLQRREISEVNQQIAAERRTFRETEITRL